MSRSFRFAVAVSLALIAPSIARAHADLDAQLHEATHRVLAHQGDARAWLRRGELYRIRGEWAAAESDYARAERLDPSLDVVLLCRGRMLAQSGRAAEALAPLDRFVAARPGHVEGRVARARARAAAGDPAGSVSDWNAAILAASDEDARPEWYLERAAARLSVDPLAIGRVVDELMGGYRRLGGAASLRRKILELRPGATLPLVKPPEPLQMQAPPAPASALLRGPYLQRGTPSSIVVRWRTDTATDGVVRYGLDPATLTSTASEGSITTEHAVALSGLSASTRYYYSVGSATETLAGGSADYFFVTSPAPGTTKPFRAWVLGDSGTANGNAAAVRDAYAAFTGSRATDLWLMLGDNAYPDGTDADYQGAVFAMYPSMLRGSVLWPAFGNHDGHSADSDLEIGPYYEIFTLPRAAEAGGAPSGTEAYYSFDYGNVHYVCLDSYESDRSTAGPMLTWLDQDLSSTAQDWIVAFWHHPPYTKGSHNSDVEGELIDMRENANPIIEAHGVDLVLTGHSHSYERSFLIDGHYGDSSTFTPATHVVDGGSGHPYQKPALGTDPHEGAVYAVAGSSGQISGGSLNHPAMVVSLNVLGSMVLDFNGNRLDAIFLDAAGTVRDSFTIVKQPSLLPSTDFEGAPRTGPAPLAVTFADKTLNGPIAWSWDLDGDSFVDATSQNPSRIYTAPGLYTVSLTATNVGGSSQATKPGYVCATAPAPPAAVAGLTIAADRTTLSWSPVALATTFDIVRGQLSTLRTSGGSFAVSTTACVENDGADTTAPDPEVPVPGAGFWYLVRAADCAGRPGTFDDGTQVAPRDAGIAASAAACP